MRRSPKLRRAALAAATDARRARAAAARVEVERHAKLREIEAWMSGNRGAVTRACDLSGGPACDVSGVARGQCPACNACPGYAMPPTGQDHMLYCSNCGCLATAHEPLRTNTSTGRRSPQRPVHAATQSTRAAATQSDWWAI